jgi:hypothetical protein
MSSTGLIEFNASYTNSDIIDVNQKLTINNIDIVALIIIIFLIYQKVYMIYQRMYMIIYLIYQEI